MKTPKTTYHNIKLPLTTLHYVKCGDGPPLIMVPATISEIENWLDLAQFMAQKFTVYFFELPGHGESAPFEQSYSSKLVAQTIEDFMDELGLEKVSLMGFSFGGILAMHSLKKLGDRIEKLILLAPCVSHKTIWFTDFRKQIVRTSSKLFYSDKLQSLVIKIVNNEKLIDFVVLLLIKFGRVEARDKGLREKLLNLKPATLDVLVHQIDEITNSEPINEIENLKTPCYLGMSIYDPLLKYADTKSLLSQKFENIVVEEFDFPYHQPPKPFTFEELNRDFSSLLNKVTNNR